MPGTRPRRTAGARIPAGIEGKNPDSLAALTGMANRVPGAGVNAPGNDDPGDDLSVRVSDSRVESGPLAVTGRLAGPWWAYLIGGIAWVLIAAVILRFNIASVATIGLLLGALFLLSAVDEFVIATVRPRWGWAHALLGILFIGAAIWSFVRPFGAFWALASVLGIVLVVTGTIHIITAISSTAFNDAWWLGVIGGLLEFFIGFWITAQSFRAQAVFLIIWAGLFALFRGIFEIVLAFELRSAQHSTPSTPST